jgi:hypothetical protein
VPGILSGAKGFSTAGRLLDKTSGQKNYAYFEIVMIESHLEAF